MRDPSALDWHGDGPWTLGDPLALGLVESGELALFAVPRLPDGAAGARHHLLTLEAGSVVGGLPPRPAYELIAVPLGGAVIRSLALDFDAEPSQANDAALQWALCLNRLQGLLLAGLDNPDAGLAAEPGEVQLPEQLSWTMQQSPEQVRASLEAQGSLTHRAIGLHLRQQHLQDAQRMATRLRSETRSNSHIQRDLAAVLAPPTEPERDPDPWFAALCAIGMAANIEFRRPHPASAPDDPLRAITGASHVRHRRVSLTGDWWRRDNGPLLAIHRLDGRPIALLPETARRYRYLDPVADRQGAVDEAIAATLRPHAVMLYRPFSLATLTQQDLLGFAWTLIREDARVVLSVAALAAALGIVVPQATYWLLTTVIPSGDHHLLLQLGIALFVISAALPALRLVQDFAVLRAETRAEAGLDAALWDRVLGMQLPFFRDTPAGDLAQRMGTIGQLRRVLAGTTVQSIVSGVFSVTFLAQLFLYSVPMALVGLLLGVGIVAYMAISARLVIKERLRVGLPAANTQAQVVNLIDGLAKIRVARMESHALANVIKSYAIREREDFVVQHYQDRFALVIELMPLLALMLFYAGFAAQAATPGGASQMGAYVAFTAAFGGFLNGALGIGNAISTLIGTEGKWRKLMKLVNAPLENLRNDLDPGTLAGAISLRRVSFRYAPKAPMILRELSLEIAPGEFVAIVGDSGSGKSTLLRVLLGFEAHEAGKIYLDGHDFNGLDLQAVRRQIGTVLQNGRITRGSLYDNVANGHGLTYDELYEAIDAAGLSEDLASMPMGMYTEISEGGSNLSAGQRQRLLIARALARKPAILLLDEATSSLDGKTQAVISEHLRQLRCTRVVVAHRLSTVRQADRILVMEGGTIVQEGRFEALIQAEGPFRRLMEGQVR